MRRKRQRQSEISEEEGRAAVEATLKLNAPALFNDSAVTPLPYPGIGRAPDRPPIQLSFVGSEGAYTLFCEYGANTRNVVVTGPRGFGKSSDMRAAACAAFQDNVMWFPSQRLVCIWNMEAVLEKLVRELCNALWFTYLFPYNQPSNSQQEQQQGTEHLEQQEEQPADSEPEQGETTSDEPAQEQGETTTDPSSLEQAQVLEEIRGLSSLDEVVSFIKKRKEQHGEVFHFFVDGWEVLDELDYAGKDVCRKLHRGQVQAKLDIVFSEGSRVFKTASAKSNCARTDPTAHVKCDPFNEEQYAAYASKSILGALAARQYDIDFLTGRVPFLLHLLCESCANLVGHFKSAAVQEQRLNLKYPLNCSLATLAAEQTRKLQSASNEELAELVEDNWDAVKELFRKHPEIVKLQKAIDRIELKSSTCHSMAEMGRLDPTFFVEEEERFCSGFIERMYIHAFRSKEGKALRGAWMDYCRYLVEQDYVNWSCAGWLVEDAWADAVKRKGAYFGTTLNTLTGLNLKEFTERPVLKMAEMNMVKPGHGWLYKPKLHSLPYVDAVIVWIDMSGKLHIVAVQLTVNVDRHLQSATLFMSLQHLKLWFPDLDLKSVKLHFVFVGCSEAYKNKVTEVDKKPITRKLRGGKSTGVAAYRFTYVPLVQSLTTLERHEVETIRELAERRVMEAPDVPLSVADLRQLKKEELKEVLQQYGLDPKSYRLKADMVTALEQVL